MSYILKLIASLIVLLVPATGCNLPLLIFPHSNPTLADSTNCSFPIHERYNWSLLSLRLPPLDNSNHDWMNAFRDFEPLPDCLHLEVAYAIADHSIGLHSLELGIVCIGETDPAPIRLEMTRKDPFLSVTYRGEKFSLDPHCIDFDKGQRFELKVGEWLRIVQNGSIMTIGEVRNGTKSFESCSCAGIRAYELSLAECRAKQMGSSTGNVKLSTGDGSFMWFRLVSMIVVCVGVLLVATAFGFKKDESGSDY